MGRIDISSGKSFDFHLLPYYFNVLIDHMTVWFTSMTINTMFLDVRNDLSLP